MSDEFENTHGDPDDGLFFAGIGAEDDVEELLDEEEALLADTKVRADDEVTGAPGMMPLMGAGAGGVGAVGLGAYAGGTRGDSKSRGGATAPVAGAAISFQDVPDQAHGAHIDADGRLLSDDPWGVGEVEELPSAWTSTSSSEAPRTRGGSGTRGEHLGRSDQAGTTMAPGATLGGIGGMAGGAPTAAAAAASGGSQQGGISLSVLQNLQTNKATSSAFAPMPSTGVSAAGAGTFHGDPALLVSQAIAAGHTDGVATDQTWLEHQLRQQDEQHRGGIVGINPALLQDEDDSDADDEDSEDSSASSGRGTRGVAAGAAGVAGAGGLGGWWGTRAPKDSGSAPVVRGEHTDAGTQTGGQPAQSSWGWNGGSGPSAPGGFTGSHVDPGVKPSGAGGFTPAPGGPGGGGGSGGVGAPPAGGWKAPGAAEGPGGGPPPVAPPRTGAFGPTPEASGTDFTVSHDALGNDAAQWRRLAEEMDEVLTRTRGVRDAASSFGIISEAVGPYSRATDQMQRWAAQASSSFVELATQLNASAALYRSNEQQAIHRTGRVFDA